MLEVTQLVLEMVKTQHFLLVEIYPGGGSIGNHSRNTMRERESGRRTFVGFYSVAGAFAVLMRIQDEMTIHRM